MPSNLPMTAVAIASLMGGANALVLTTPMRVTHSRVTAPQMNFFDDLQANFKKMIDPPSMPTMEEAEVYCRDDESTGCTIEMLDLLQQQKAEKAKIENFRWSREIDDAVVKPE